jgi:hypothetical protein
MEETIWLNVVYEKKAVLIKSCMCFNACCLATIGPLSLACAISIEFHGLCAHEFFQEL